MKVIFYSPNFLPLTGGLEHAVRDWAYGLTEAGHFVQVITSTPNAYPEDFPFEVYRNIGHFKAWQLMRTTDVVVQFNVSLKGILPCIFSFKPLLISQHTTNLDIDGKPLRFSAAKNFIANRLAKANTACSHYVARFYRNVTVIHSPYNEQIFQCIPTVFREFDIMFLGRLVSDKGCDILIKALGILKTNDQIVPNLTIVGEGPEKEKLLKLALEENVLKQINFAGKVNGKALSILLNSHRIMVVPSIWEEPFGIVALEGLASGCEIIVAEVGGLPEAVGKFGYFFKRNDASDLARTLKNALLKPSKQNKVDPEVQLHLKQFTKKASVEKLIRLLENLK